MGSCGRGVLQRGGGCNEVGGGCLGYYLVQAGPQHSTFQFKSVLAAVSQEVHISFGMWERLMVATKLTWNTQEKAI